MSGTIEQEVHLPSSPARVYDALTRSDQFTALTGAPAEIGSAEGDSFQAFGGMITGRQIEMKPGERLVQAWRAGTWDDGHYSILNVTLSPDGEGSLLSMRHQGFPRGEEEHLAAGWHKMYWEPLQKYLEAKQS